MSYRKSIAAFMRHDAKPVEKYSHQPRLYKLAVHIAACHNRLECQDGPEGQGGAAQN